LSGILSSYSFRATALIFCRMFIHIMAVCMSTGICQIFTKWQVVGLYFLLTSYIMETWFVWGIIPISPQVIPLYLHIRNEKLKVLSVCKLSMIQCRTSYIVLKNFWLVYNFLLSGVTHFILKKITPNKTTLSIIIKCGGILLF
jgi:hypothetical protein